MPLLPIVKEGHPVLRKKTEAVLQIDASIQDLIEDMYKTMYAAPGIGLAANQVGKSLNLAVIDIQPDGKRSPFVIINPVIVSKEGAIEDEEGCLSVPGFSAKVKRAAKVKVRALNESGVPIEIEAEGLLARCLQHEIDHLNGKLYIDHLTFLKRLHIKKLISRRKKANLF